MAKDIIEQLVAAVDNAKQTTKFCTSGYVQLNPDTRRGLSIEGLGEIAMPLRPKSAKEIIAFADTAPYGKGTKTIINRSVSWSIGADRLARTASA